MAAPCDDCLYPVPEVLRTDYIVMVVRNAAEALDALRECLPDGILPDLAMPIMDGRTVLEARRDKLALAKVPVMISLQNFTTAPSVVLRPVSFSATLHQRGVRSFGPC